MNTITKTSPHHVRRQLLKNKQLNIESVGKLDMHTLTDVADAPDGKGTVVRLIMGATRAMPLRAITYADTALRVAQAIPCEQVQIVHANRLGGQVNGINAEKSAHDAKQLAAITQMHAAAFFPDVLPKLLHGQDQALDLSDFVAAAEIVFRSRPEISAALGQKGTKHGGDSLVYSSAHTAFQDTDRLVIEPLLAGAPVQVPAERIVSVGCQQERIFYLTRMAMRQQLSVDLVDTAQLFTGHISPPYFVARGGEPLLGDALHDGVDLTQFGDFAAHRDMTTFIQTIQGVNHG
jgi:hypothetical protein